MVVRLTEVGPGTTNLTYDADAIVGGMIGGVGQRMLSGVAKKTAGEFFRAVDDVLTGTTPAPGRLPEAEGQRPMPPRRERRCRGVYGAPGASSLGSPAVGGTDFAKGAVVGAVAAIVGVLVGGLLGGRRR